MYLIDASYFIGKISVDNVNEPNSAVAEQLGLYIDEKVRLLLQNTLGLVLYNELDNYIVNGSLPNTAPPKWKNLVNGKEYQVDGKTYGWVGLIHSQGTLYKKSLLADFVYHEWRTDQLTKDNVIQPKNVAVTNQNSFLVDVWNGFISQYQGGYIINTPKNNLINRACIVAENSYDSNVSLLKFLIDNEVDYPDAKLYVFPNVTYSNSLGI